MKTCFEMKDIWFQCSLKFYEYILAVLSEKKRYPSPVFTKILLLFLLKKIKIACQIAKALSAESMKLVFKRKIRI